MARTPPYASMASTPPPPGKIPHIIVDDKLTWKQQTEFISGKMVRNIGILKRIRNFIPQECLLLLYHTLIEPYLRYCSIVWGQCSESLKDRLQTLQNKAARIIIPRHKGQKSSKLYKTEYKYIGCSCKYIRSNCKFIKMYL